MRRRPESPLSSRQPHLIFSSSDAATDPERGFTVGGGWSPRCYACSFCGREFSSAQALGGHMNIHRRDRARLRTSTSPAAASVPNQADLSPIVQSSLQSAHSRNHHTFEAAFKDSPTLISSPTTITEAPTFGLLDRHPPADTPLLALVAHRSHDAPLATSFSATLMDLMPLCSSRSCAISISNGQNESYSIFPEISPHAASLLVNSSLEHVEALNTCAGQVPSIQQASLESCSGASAAAGAELVHCGQSKRARRNPSNTATVSIDVKSTTRRIADERSSTSIPSAEESDSLQDAGRTSTARPSTHIHDLTCVDLELRLGQVSPSDSRASTASDCRGRTTASRPP